MSAWWKSSKTNQNQQETAAISETNSNPFINDNLTSSFEEFSPRNYEDVEEIANALVLQKSVKLSLKDTVISDRRRILDFLFGIAYVLNFDIKKIDIDVYEFKFNK